MNLMIMDKQYMLFVCREMLMWQAVGSTHTLRVGNDGVGIPMSLVHINVALGISMQIISLG